MLFNGNHVHTHWPISSSFAASYNVQCTLYWNASHTAGAKATATRNSRRSSSSSSHRCSKVIIFLCDSLFTLIFCVQMMVSVHLLLFALFAMFACSFRGAQIDSIHSSMHRHACICTDATNSSHIILTFRKTFAFHGSGSHTVCKDQAYWKTIVALHCFQMKIFLLLSPFTSVALYSTLSICWTSMTLANWWADCFKRHKQQHNNVRLNFIQM